MPAPRRPVGPTRQTCGTDHDHHRTLAACIFDVDGVLLARPHEHAWREALESDGASPRRLSNVAGKPRFSGAVLPWRRWVSRTMDGGWSPMQRIHLDGGQSLLDVFNANVCGCDARQGKPHPEILLLAATELGVAPAHCLVVEDAPVGIEAARAGRMTALGGARLGNTALLRATGTDLVVTSLDKAPIDELAAGRLPASGEGQWNTC